MAKTISAETTDLATLIQEVKTTHEEIVITEHGQPVVRVVPAASSTPMTIEDLRGSVIFVGDILEPVDEWDADQ